MLGGFKVDIDVADSQGNPQVGLTQLRKLVEQDHVDIIFGPLSAAVGAAIAPYIAEHKIAALFPIGLRGRPHPAYPERLHRAHRMVDEPTHARVGRLRLQRAEIPQGRDDRIRLHFGWESIGGFVDTFQRDGGKVVNRSGRRSSPLITRRSSRSFRAMSTRWYAVSRAQRQSISSSSTRLRTEDAAALPRERHRREHARRHRARRRRHHHRAAVTAPRSRHP